MARNVPQGPKDDATPSASNEDVSIAMSVHVGDLLKQTGDLAADEFGAHFRLLLAAWTRDARLSGEPARLARLAGVDRAEFGRVWDAIGSLWTPQADGTVVQLALLDQLERARAAKRFNVDRARHARHVQLLEAERRRLEAERQASLDAGPKPAPSRPQAGHPTPTPDPDPDPDPDPRRGSLRSPDPGETSQGGAQGRKGQADGASSSARRRPLSEKQLAGLARKRAVEALEAAWLEEHAASSRPTPSRWGNKERGQAWSLLQKLPAEHGPEPADRVAEARRRIANALEHLARGSKFWRERGAITIGDVCVRADEFASPPRGASTAAAPPSSEFRTGTVDV